MKNQAIFSYQLNRFKNYTIYKKKGQMSYNKFDRLSNLYIE